MAILQNFLSAIAETPMGILSGQWREPQLTYPSTLRKRYRGGTDRHGNRSRRPNL
jgi:hypothetical protein